MTSEIDHLRAFRAEDAISDPEARRSARAALMARIEAAAQAAGTPGGASEAGAEVDVTHRSGWLPGMRAWRWRPTLSGVLTALAVGVAVTVAAGALIALGRLAGERHNAVSSGGASSGAVSTGAATPPIQASKLIELSRALIQSRVVLAWDDVVIRTDGTGTITFSARSSRTSQVSLRLSPAQLQRARGLARDFWPARLSLAEVRRTRRPSARWVDCSISVHGEQAQWLPGQIPHGMATLVGVLDALMTRYDGQAGNSCVR
jgi:hypothetical protein